MSANTTRDVRRARSQYRQVTASLNGGGKEYQRMIKAERKANQPDNVKAYRWVMFLVFLVFVLAVSGYIAILCSNGAYRLRVRWLGRLLGWWGRKLAHWTYAANQYQRLVCETRQPGSTTE